MTLAEELGIGNIASKLRGNAVQTETATQAGESAGTETVTPETPPVTEPVVEPANTPEAESATTEAPATETPPPAPEDDGSGLEDFVLSEEPVVDTSEKVSTPYGTLSKKFGKEFKTEDDIVAFVESVRQTPEKEVVRQPYLPGVDADSAELVAKALDEGVISLKEIAASQLLARAEDMPRDEIVFGLLVELDKSKGGKKTAEDIREEMDGMSELEMDLTHRARVREINQERRDILAKVNGAMEASRVARENAAIKEQQARSQFTKEVNSVLEKMEVVAGTNTSLDTAQKATLARVISDKDALTKALFGAGESPDINRAAHLLARVLFPKTIEKNLQAAARNGAIKSVIERESNITIAPSSNPVTKVETTPKTAAQQSVSRIWEYLES